MYNFIEKAKKIHGDKYDYSKVEYINNHTKVCIICPEHGEFWQTPNNHLHDYGCPKCKSDKIGLLKRKDIVNFIKEAKKVHGDKYDYSKVEYKNNSTKVCIICPEHGEFWQTPNHHLQGHGCPICKNVKKSNTDEFIEKAKKIHGDKYDYSKVEYINNHTKVCIICPVHGEFWQTPKNHLKGQGCNKCAIHYRNQKNALTTEQFIEKARKIHGEKYDYSKVEYINSHTKVCIICPTHGEFWQTSIDHLQNCGCPKCGNIISNGENNINDFINKKLKIKTITKTKNFIYPYELDIFIPSRNIAIEYNGVIWHSEKFGKNKDYHLKKTELCSKQGIRLIHIFEDEWLEHKDIVESKMRHIFNSDNDLPKVFARNCSVKQIKHTEAKDFLEKNHIQGFSKSSIYLGCYYNDELVGVMTFKRERKDSDKWELTRFATDINKHCVGVGGKLFKYFVRTYNPSEVKSFADRRWTLDKDDNLYTKLGFKLDEVLKPDYHYTNGVILRSHKFNFRKQILLKKYPNSDLTEDMTEYEMTQKLGFYRIWDCGLYKFMWKNNIYNK